MDLGQWKQALDAADDDYLAGLANKGIVKRAYKELPDTQADITQEESGFLVQMGDVSCRLALPLGSSQCSCVSRSICKHIIIAVLKTRDYLKEQVEGAPDGDYLRGQGEGVPDGGEEDRTESPEEKENTASAPAFSEVASYPLEKARKVMGSRRFQSLIECARLGMAPKITVTSVITVEWPEDGTKVKLLEPLAYSSCSCHKKEMCSHRAEAIVWYQLKAGLLTADMLEQAREDEELPDLERIHGLAGTVRLLLEGLLRTGLARSSQDVLDSLERLAILCHNRELPDFERDARALRDSWQNYFRRMASFRPEDLMRQLTRLYRKAQALEEARTPGRVRQLAGQFKAEYRLAGDLILIGIGARHFLSKTGYEGETVYFLEASSGQWYTYTDARPVFYEQRGGRRPAGRGSAPWDLRVSMDELPQLRIRLRQARASSRNRLSSGSQTRGEVLGPRQIHRKEIESCYYTDFARLFREQIGSGPLEEEREEGDYGFDETRHPVLVHPSAAGPGVFDRISQTFRMELGDSRGITVSLEAVYSKQQEPVIRSLERISRRIQEGRQEIPCFVGDIYLADGEMKLYPIAFLEPKEIMDEE